MSSDQLFSLPFEEQVGQFFFIGLPGTEVDAEARELIEEIKPGGIILFGRNIETAEQVRKLLEAAVVQQVEGGACAAARPGH